MVPIAVAIRLRAASSGFLLVGGGLDLLFLRGGSLPLRPVFSVRSSSNFWQRFFGTDGMMTKKRWLEDDENKPAKINRADYLPTAPLGVEIHEVVLIGGTTRVQRTIAPAPFPAKLPGPHRGLMACS